MSEQKQFLTEDDIKGKLAILTASRGGSRIVMRC